MLPLTWKVTLGQPGPKLTPGTTTEPENNEIVVRRQRPLVPVRVLPSVDEGRGRNVHGGDGIVADPRIWAPELRI